ncbi:uncharacterized protein B0T15DRAFT_521995 [Chaetomium strumarium]|uniref:NmrA-like domain-containing protein n=1 Tax=Chaetomium strumarium TaxID=1170767 RepID=A0AAJ0M7C9_9PEZI|nr:hypothetical protein B0T15DRAFT_521995 [Chaetomium strumarium]
MTVDVLFIGAAGHIGAAVLQALKTKFPELPVAAIVRSHKDAQHLSDAYNENLTVIQGSLEECELLEAAASKARLIINCAPDVPYAEGIAALLRGLASHSSRAAPRFYIHTSGAARLWDPPNGDVEGRVWDDVADVDSLPASADATHAPTDMQVAAAASPSAGVHTAIISPCFVIGRSPSRAHAAPITFPHWMDVVRAVGGPFTVASGRNVTSFVDTEVLAGLYVRLVEDALRYVVGGVDAVPDENVWGARAYYFASTLELSMREFNDRYLVPALKRSAAAAWLKKEEATELSVDEVCKIVMGRFGDAAEAGLWSRHIAQGFGTSMRTRPTRATKYLGFPFGEGLPGLDAAVAAMLRKI